MPIRGMIRRHLIPNTGTKLYCISGDVNEPGVYELDLGLTCTELIEVAGGLRGRRGESRYSRWEFPRRF